MFEMGVHGGVGLKIEVASSGDVAQNNFNRYRDEVMI
jgi:hypothetical protein